MSSRVTASSSAARTIMWISVTVLCRETGSFATTGGCQPFVEFVEVIGAESAQRDVTDRGVDIAVNEPRVPVRGTRSDVSALVRHPCTGQELGNGDGPASRRRSGDAFAVEAGSDSLGFVAVMADRDPPATFSTSQWIESVVGDDIEAGLAFNDVGHPQSSTTSGPTRRSPRH